MKQFNAMHVDKRQKVLKVATLESALIKTMQAQPLIALQLK